MAQNVLRLAPISIIREEHGGSKSDFSNAFLGFKMLRIKSNPIMSSPAMIDQGFISVVTILSFY